MLSLASLVRSISLLTATLLLTSCQPQQRVTVYKNLEYKSYPTQEGTQKLLLDLYLPQQTTQPLPVLIYIHGGGWREGSKEDCPGKIVAKRGYALACINYRLSDVARFPAQIHDVKEAVRWLRAHHHQYNLNPEDFGAWGPSAGGHLSSLLGTSGGVEFLEGDTKYPETSSAVQAVCNWYGATDFTAVPPAFEEPVTPQVWEKYRRAPWFLYTVATHLVLGSPVAANLELAAIANPINYIDSDDPPFLIVHGEQDKVVPIGQSQILAEALAAKEVPVTFIRDPDLKHSHAGENDQLFAPALIDLAIDFFDRHLQSENN